MLYVCEQFNTFYIKKQYKNVKLQKPKSEEQFKTL